MCVFVLELPDLADKNPGPTANFEFQINSEESF